MRTAPKKDWRSKRRRFVVNMRFLNRFVPKQESKCEVITLSRLRNVLLYGPQGTDDTWYLLVLASGYHNIWIHPSQWTIMRMALHVTVSELPENAVEYIRSKWPECENKASGNFYFTMRPSTKIARNPQPKVHETHNQNCAKPTAKSARNPQPKLQQAHSQNCNKPTAKTARNPQPKLRETHSQNCTKPTPLG